MKTDLEKELKKQFQNVAVPEDYEDRLRRVLEELPEREKPHKTRHTEWLLGVIICIAGVVCILLSGATQADANIFTDFKMKIMDILNMGGEDAEDIGVSAEKERIQGKPDLMIELREKVMDSHNIYLLIKVTAPANVTLGKTISFSYFGFCEGENYNTQKLIGGVRSGSFVEALEGKSNVATYAVSISTDEKIEQDTMFTLFLKDLTEETEQDAHVLAEGMWSLTFPASYTVRKKVVLQGTENMSFSFLEKTALVEKLRLTPMGLLLVSDVSDVPYEKLGVSDTVISIRFRMLDGTEQTVISHDPDDTWLAEGGSSSIQQKAGKIFQKSSYQFSQMQNINKIVGIYVEDCHIPLGEGQDG